MSESRKWKEVSNRICDKRKEKRNAIIAISKDSLQFYYSNPELMMSLQHDMLHIIHELSRRLYYLGGYENFKAYLKATNEPRYLTLKLLIEFMPKEIKEGWE